MDNKTFIDNLSSQTGHSKDEIASLIASLGSIISEALQNGDVIAVPTLGNFEPKMKQERMSVHPSSGKRLLVPPKLSIAFKPSSLLKQKIR